MGLAASRWTAIAGCHECFLLSGSEFERERGRQFVDCRSHYEKWTILSSRPIITSKLSILFATASMLPCLRYRLQAARSEEQSPPRATAADLRCWHPGRQRSRGWNAYTRRRSCATEAGRSLRNLEPGGGSLGANAPEEEIDSLVLFTVKFLSPSYAIV